MTTYTSKKGVISAPNTAIYMSFVDPRSIVKQIQENMPAEGLPQAEGRIIEVTYDYIRFEIKGIELQVNVLAREPFTKITFGGDKPLAYEVSLHFDQVDAFSTSFWIEANIDLNLFMRGIVGGKIQSGLDAFVDAVASGKMPDFKNVF